MTHEGIPDETDATGLPTSPECPFCSRKDTELFSAFGSQLSVSTYWCRRCGSPFEFMKWGGAPWKGSVPHSEEGDAGE